MKKNISPFKINDSVKVKSGVLDPDIGTFSIEGWQGRVIAINPDDNGRVLIDIEWDSITLRNISKQVIAICEKEELDWTQMGLYPEDIELTNERDSKEDTKETLESFKMRDAVLRLYILPLAKKIYKGEIKPERINSVEDFMISVQDIGNDNSEAFEMYIDVIDVKIEEINRCLTEQFFESASVLLFTLIEREINVIIRVLMNVRGFSHNTITQLLQHTNL